MPDTSNWIELLDLHVRTYNVLKRAGIARIDQLQAASDAELLHLSGFGKKMLREVRTRLAVGQNGQGTIMHGKKIAWATYGNPDETGATLTKETVHERASSLLGQTIYYAKDDLEYQVIAVQVVEDAHKPDQGYILIDAAIIPETQTELTWNGKHNVTRIWEPRIEPANRVTITANKVTTSFVVANQEDADVLFLALRRVQEVSTVIDELPSL